MKLDIKPIHEEYRSCTEDIICSVAAWLDMDHELMYTEAWDFIYDGWTPGHPYGIGDRLSEGIDRTWHNICHYHGLQLEYKKNIFTFNQARSTIFERLREGYPVMIYLDGYWCDWRKEGRNRHIYSNVLVIGYDASDKLFICIDPYYLDKTIGFPAEKMQLAYKNLIIISQNKEIKEENVLEVLHKSPRRLLKKFSMMYHFAHDIEHTLDFNLETLGEDEMINIKLFNILKFIIRRRKQYSAFLKYVYTHYHKVRKNYSGDMENIADKWNMILKLLMKSYYSEDWIIRRKHIAKLILDIVDLEKKLAYQIIQGES